MIHILLSDKEFVILYLLMYSLRYADIVARLKIHNTLLVLKNHDGRYKAAFEKYILS